MAKENIPTVYDPASVETKWYKVWEETRAFHAEPRTDGKAYSIVIPPPNVTGQLHMGHALDNALQDILIRWRRMQGYDTLWMPGCDHAGIATQIKVEEVLAKDMREEVVRINVTVTDMYGRRETRPMPITLFRPAGEGKHAAGLAGQVLEQNI